jgi:hypothetical protein
MKKIAIFIVILGMALSYSCKKDENKLVNTIFKGQLVLNGTDEPIEISNEQPRPKVAIYGEKKDKDNDITIGGAPAAELIASVEVDEEGKFYLEADLYENDEYTFGVLDIDKSKYLYSVEVDAVWPIRSGLLLLKPGEVNVRNIYVTAAGWVRPRFINSNSDLNNQDVFDYGGGIGSLVSHQFGPYLYGNVDSTFSNAIFQTWGGTYMDGYGEGNPMYNRHYVSAKITRNGVTRDTTIFYSVPPFDTTVVEIRY